ncbi:hypothetical protein HDU96_001988 [Phlyctochytrium bullatum]|nr:hypothetical protein HDU96_001988 [Phlyctochytrium bullatum]
MPRAVNALILARRHVFLVRKPLLQTDIDLPKLQKDLDAQGLEIVENQKEGLQSRKKLAEQTKDFKKLPEDEKMKEFKVLLKAYQTEIDHVTKRSKLAETCFLTLYRLLAEAPDPTPLIAAVAEHAKHSHQLAAIQQENKRLKDELGEAEKELAVLRSSDGSVGVLKARLAKYEAMMDQMVTEKVTAKEMELKTVMDEKIRVYKETEYSLQRQLNHAKDQLVSLQVSHDKTQSMLVNHTRQYDEEVAVKLGELDIIAADLERANQKISVLERENEKLRKEAGTGGVAASVQEWLEITKLLADVDSYRHQLQEKEASLNRRITELEREAAVRNLENAQFKEQLARYDDYEQIKKELHVMKLVEFAAKSDTSTDLDVTELQDTGDPNVDYSLEKLLMEKNKRFQAEITSLKLALEEARSKIGLQEKELREANAKVDSQASLIVSLEEDVYKLNSIVASRGGAAGVAQQLRAPRSPKPVAGASDDPILSIQTPSPATALGLDNPEALAPVLSPPTLPQSVVAAASSTSPSSPSPNPANPAEPTGAAAQQSSSTIVPILIGQRDRYRQRNGELEAEVRTLKETVAELRNGMEGLRNDNVKLYEKLRYTETFQGAGPADDGKKDGYVIQMSDPRPARRSTAAAARTHTTSTAALTPTTPTDDVTSRYRTLYDANLDPFQRFHRQEELRRVRDLNPAERGLLTFTRLMAGNRYTRLFFAGYSVALHLLVFATLYMLSQWEECRHDHGVPPNAIVMAPNPKKGR